MLLGFPHTMSKPAEKNGSFGLKVSEVSVHHGGEGVTGQSSSPHGSQAVRDSAYIHCLSPFILSRFPGCYSISIPDTVTNTPN